MQASDETPGAALQGFKATANPTFILFAFHHPC